MSTMKKVSYKNIASKLPALETTTITLEGEMFGGLTVTVKNRLTITEMSALIADIVSTLIDAETGDYNPEYADLVEMMLQLKHYAGISIGKTDLSYAYRVLTETDLYQQVISHVDQEQLFDVGEAVANRVEFTKKLILSTAGHKAVELLTRMETLMTTMESMSVDVGGDKMQLLLDAVKELTSVASIQQEIMQPDLDAEPAMLTTAE